MRVFKTRWFFRFARKERMSDQRLLEAICRAEQGIIDAELGGRLIKQRVGRAGGGRSSGYRTLIAYHSAVRSVFLFGFAKSQRDNIGDEDLESLKLLARRLLTLDEVELDKAVETGELIEIEHEEEAQTKIQKRHQ